MSRRIGPEGRWGWTAKVDQVREANRLGKLTNLLCVPQAVSEQEALYCFASYLMALEGERAYFFYAPAYQMAAQKTWYPFYDADLGKPVGDYETRDGAYWRPFAKGAVAANPTDKAVMIALTGRYVTLDGKECHNLTLAPKQGAILLLGSP
jgi:hypothetical protein